MAGKKPAPKAKPKAKAKAAVKPIPKAKPAAKKRPSWFDETTQAPMIDKYAKQLKSFLTALADGVVDQAEVKAQEANLVKVMKEVEKLLNDEQHAKVTELLCELTAYDIMQMLHTLQGARPQAAFKG